MGPIDLKNNEFIYLNDRKPTTKNMIENDYIFKILRKETKFYVDFYPQILVEFDGNSAQILAAPQLRGTNCGLCGDYNRNVINELKDPKVRYLLTHGAIYCHVYDVQMCVLRNGEEMARAWTLDTKMCETRITKPDCVMPFTDRILY